MKQVNESRRSALKKLGLGTSAVYVAPAVTALVVPQHATATSSSSSSSSSLVGSTSVFEFVTSSSTLQLKLDAGDWSTVGSPTSNSSITAYGSTSTFYFQSGSYYFFIFGNDSSAPFSTGTGNFTVNGTQYTVSTLVR
jgi:hypothetical protein